VGAVRDAYSAGRALEIAAAVVGDGRRDRETSFDIL